MSGLKPTGDRIALADAIDAGNVTNHGWRRGLVILRDGYSETVVTARVAEFRAAGLLEEPVSYPCVERLNAAGDEWLAEFGDLTAAGGAA